MFSSARAAERPQIPAGREHQYKHAYEAHEGRRTAHGDAEEAANGEELRERLDERRADRERAAAAQVNDEGPLASKAVRGEAEDDGADRAELQEVDRQQDQLEKADSKRTRSVSVMEVVIVLSGLSKYASRRWFDSETEKKSILRG